MLAHVAPCSWTAHYVNAFRAVCDAVVIGPPPGAAFLDTLQRGEAAHLTPVVDVACDFADPPPLERLWPAGWQPDLVVGIAGLGGAPLHPGVNALPCPTAFLSIDTWQCLGDYGEARAYDAVFCAQKAFVPRLRAAGSRHVAWLPLACDPAAHHPVDAAPTHDVAFAGSASLPVHARRRALLQALGRRFSLVARERVYGDALCHLFAQGRLAFNHCAVREVNMRVFEAMAMGRPLLNNAEAADNGLCELFEPDRHLALYDGEAGLLRQAQAFIDDPARAARMAAAGREEALARHTYEHRVRALIEAMATLAPATDHAPRPGGDTPLDWLPTIPGRVLDLGLGLRASKHAARRRGAVALEGLAWSTDDAAARRGSYDAMRIWPEAPPPDSCDTAVIVGGAPPGLDAAVQSAHAALAPGGTLLWRAHPDEVAAIGAAKPGEVGAWLARRGFVIRRVGAPGADGACHVLARKRTRSVADIVAEVFAELDLPEMDIASLLARIPPEY